VEFVLAKKRLALVMKKVLGLVAFSILLVSCAPAPAVVAPELEPAATEAAEEVAEPVPTFEVSERRVDSELCKFEDKTSEFANRDPWEPFTYFPNVGVDPYHLPTIGEGNLALVFLDWEDMQGTDADREYYLEQAEIMAEWYQLVSQGKYSIDWHVSDQWGRLPGSWKDMKRGSFGSDEEEDPVANQEVLDLAVAATDDYFDYTGIDYVIFAIPLSGGLSLRGAEIGDVVFYSGIHGFQWQINPANDGSAPAVVTREGSMGNWALAGTTFQDIEGRSPAWIFWAHEMGHMFGFESHHWQPFDVGGGNQFYDNPMSPVGLFAHQWYQVRAVSGWTSWVAGWLDDDQVQCVEASEVEDEVFAVNNRRAVDGATKMVVIRTGDTTGLVIESREWDPEIDAPTQKAADGFYDGILMYHIDSSRPLADQSMIPLMPHPVEEVWDEEMWPGPAVSGVDSMFQEGESVEYEGLKIEVLSMQDGVDYVEVSRHP
jgi:hypothetical protein